MKTEILYLQGLNKVITFYIGKNQNENFEVINKGNLNDLWFHANDISSCHVIASVPDNINKKDIRYIIKAGALLCKKNTNKLKNIKNVKITYTTVNNIELTNVEGKVNIKNEKIITI